MNKETMTSKVDEYTITLHRGSEEPKEMEQKQMAKYATCMFNMKMKPLIKHLKEYYPELQPNVSNILKKGESKLLNGKILNPRVFK